VCDSWFNEAMLKLLREINARTHLALEPVPDEVALGEVYREQQRRVADEEDRAELHEEQVGTIAGAGACRSRGTGGGAAAAAVRRLRAPQVAPGHHRALHVVRPAVVRRRQVHAPLRPREPTRGSEGVVAAAGVPLLADRGRRSGRGSSPAILLLPGAAPALLWHAAAAAAAGVEGVVDAEAAEDVAHGAAQASPGVEHGGGHAGELLLLRRRRRRDGEERGDAAREVIGRGGHWRARARGRDTLVRGDRWPLEDKGLVAGGSWRGKGGGERSCAWTRCMGMCLVCRD